MALAASAVTVVTPVSLVGSAAWASTAMVATEERAVMPGRPAMVATAPLVTLARAMVETAEPVEIRAWSPDSAEPAALQALAARED